jgi:CheY-like chemotaxis protein
VLDGRIQALARAHDQLTRKNWSPVSFKTLVNIEFGAYLDELDTRVDLRGADVLLAPEALSTMALVLHELVTNAVKHGALSGPNGQVSIDLSRDAVGASTISWREVGGPPVQPPSNQGFGRTIIENSVPFELNGTVDTRFRMAGLEVDIMVPANHCSEVTKSPGTAPTEVLASVPKTKPLTGQVLLLEDNLIIAMHASDMLSELGAEHVHIANSVQKAFDILDRVAIGAAVLDVNLGDETSLLVAQRLVSNGVPYILATGYGSQSDVSETFPTSPILKKPYQISGLQRALEEALIAHKARD